MPDELGQTQSQINYLLTGRAPFSDPRYKNFFGADLQKMGQGVVAGLQRPQPLDLATLMKLINEAYGIGEGVLQRRADVASQRGAAAGTAQSAALNLSNPYALTERGRQTGYASIAPQFGELAFRRGQALAGAPVTAFQSQMDMFRSLLPLLQLQAQIAQYKDQQGDFGSSVGKFLGSLAPIALGALFPPAGIGLGLAQAATGSGWGAVGGGD